ncbi:MAG: ATP-binding protein [Mariniblastus sp.]
MSIFLRLSAHFFLTALTLSISHGMLIANQPISDLKTLHEIGDRAIGRSVDLTGTITFFEPIWNFGFVQAGGHAVFIEGITTRDLQPGDKVRVTGKCSLGDIGTKIKCESMVKTGSGSPPDPIEVKISSLKIGDYDSMYVEADATVLQAVSGQGHTLLYCDDDGAKFHVCVNGKQELSQLLAIVGSKVRCAGALAITIEAGTESRDSSIGTRDIECHRIVSCEPPKIISGGKPKLLDPTKPAHSSDIFMFEGQITSAFPNFFILSNSQESRRIECRNAHGFGSSNMVRVAGSRSLARDGTEKFTASAIESFFSSRLPAPQEINDIPSDQQIWKHVVVQGRPLNVREVNGKVCFDIASNDQTHSIELKDAFPNVNLLRNTSLIEANGTIVETYPDGGCRVVISGMKNVVRVVPVYSFWKYFAWGLLPITSIFFLGFVWVKAQRNRASSQAATLSSMHNNLIATYQAISDGLLAIDNNNRVLSVNAEFCNLIGRKLLPGEPLTPAIYNDFLSRIKNKDEVEAYFSNSLELSKNENRIDVEVLNPEPKFYELFLSEIATKHRDKSGRLLILRDRTKERQLQAELIHSNKIEAVGQLVGGIAHDFNNILTSVTANLSLLNLEHSLDSVALERVNDAELAANRGSELVRRLLTYSGKTVLNPRPDSINRIIQELHQFARATFDARYIFKFDLDEVDPFVFVDPGAIEQVLLNIYLNARDAMPNGGTIVTKTRLKINDHDEPVVSISIADNGPGIGEDVREKIFDPFFTTKAGRAGTGLGLTTSKRLIVELNGELNLCREKRPGSCFTIILPVTESVPLTNENKTASPASVSGKKTVLVVDDEDAIRKICSLILEVHGFDVLTAVNGEAALAVLRTEHQRIDLVILDLTMPGISGLDVLEISNADYPEIPVILCSGYLAGISNELFEDCLKLPKPYSTQDLIETIDLAFSNEIETKPKTSTDANGSHHPTQT